MHPEKKNFSLQLTKKKNPLTIQKKKKKKWQNAAALLYLLYHLHT